MPRTDLAGKTWSHLGSVNDRKPECHKWPCCGMDQVNEVAEAHAHLCALQ